MSGSSLLRCNKELYSKSGNVKVLNLGLAGALFKDKKGDVSIRKVGLFVLSLFILGGLIYFVSALQGVSSVVLNTSTGFNLSSENLTASVSPLNVSQKYIYDWRLNGSSISYFNMPMIGGENCGGDVCEFISGINGTVGDSKFTNYNSTEGHDGFGSYQFNQFGNITFSEDLSSLTDEITISAWVKSENITIYKKNITLNNPQAEQTDYDILLNVDTATLISEGKMRSDCADIEFYNSTNGSIDYWVEGGCDSVNTSVWINMPVFPAGVSYVEMRYGDFESDVSQTFSGEFIVMSDSSGCPSGWTRVSAFDDRLLKGTSTVGSYGNTGGSDSDTRYWDITFTEPNGGTLYNGGTGTGSGYAAAHNHEHNDKTSVSDTETVLPPYETMIFCARDSLDIFTGAISIFNSTSMGDGWSSYSELNNNEYFPRGSSTAGTTGGSTTFSHDVSTSTGTPTLTMRGTSASMSGSSSTHTHSVTFTSNSRSALPDRVTAIFGKADGTNNFPAEGGIFITSAAPPMGYTMATELNGRYLMADTTYGVTTDVSAITMGTTTGETGSASGTNNNMKDGTLGDRWITTSHTHDFTATSSTSREIAPAYVNVLYYQRDVSAATVVIGSEEVAETRTSQSSADLAAKGSSHGLHYNNGTIRASLNSYSIDSTDRLENWTHLAMTYDGVTLSFYKNGILNNYLDFSESISVNAYDFVIGDSFTGFVEDVEIFERGLSPEEIGILYSGEFDTIVPNETNTGENWSVAVTPLFGTSIGSTVLSNSLEIILPNIDAVVLNTTTGYNVSWMNLTANPVNISPLNADLFYQWYLNGGAFYEEEWNVSYDGGEGSDYARGVDVDSEGNIYVTGYSNLGGTNDWYTIKYYPNGTEIFNLSYDAGNSGNNAMDVAVDSNDNFYVGGYYHDGTDTNYRLAKYYPNGTEIWVKTYDSGGADYGRGVAVDPSGNAYITGRANSNYYTIKYSSDGTVVWSKSYNSGGTDAAQGVAADSSNNVYVTGTVNDNYYTRKYYENGTVAWSKSYDSGGVDDANDIVVDDRGYVYVTGGANGNYYTIKYYPNSTEVWSKSYDSGGTDSAYSIDVDPIDNVYVTGSDGSDWHTVKYDSDGNELWNTTYDGGDVDIVRGISYDENSGSIYVAGQSNNGVDNDYALVRYYQDISGTLNSSYLEAGDVWSVRTTISSGTEIGNTVLSNNLTIVPLRVDAVVLNSTNVSTNYSNENLTAYPVNLTFLNASLNYIWYKDGEVHSGYLVNETMEYLPKGTLYQNATYNQSEGYVQLTSNTANEVGNLYYNVTNMSENWTANFEFWSGGGTGNDAIWFYIYSSSPTMAMEGTANGGYSIILDDSPDQIELRYNGVSLQANSTGTIDSSSWQNVTIVKNGTIIDVYLNGTLGLTYNDSVSRTITGDRYLGFGGRQGANTNYHRIRNLSVYTNSGLGNTDTVNWDSTFSNETWIACVQPYYQEHVGSQVCSSDILVNYSIFFENVTVFGYNDSEVSFKNLTDEIDTRAVLRGTNATFNVSIDNRTEIDKVWIKVWENVIGGVVKFFGWLTDLGDGIWNAVVPTNSSWNESEYNYTVYVNSSYGEEVNFSGSFNMSDAFIDAIVLNSSLKGNTTIENLTAWPVNVTPESADVLYEWYRNGTFVKVELGNSTSNSFIPSSSTEVGEVWQVNVTPKILTNNYNISNASYSGRSFSVASQDTIPYDVDFNNDGTKMFVVGRASGYIHEYNLSDAFNVSSASYTNAFYVAGQDSFPAGLDFNNDGTKMFVVGYGNNRVYEYNLSTGFDVSSASYTGYNISIPDTVSVGVVFNNDGTKMFISGNGGDKVLEYSLSIPFDISTGVNSANFSVASQETGINEVAFNNDGTKMIIVGYASTNVTSYDLSTGFDVSTASYSGVVLDVSSEDANLAGITFNNDGTRMYLIGNGFDFVYEYELGSVVDGDVASSSNMTILKTPSIVSNVLNATTKANLTTDNLTAYAEVVPGAEYGSKVIYDWRLNGSSIAVLNMPFDANLSCENNTKVCDYSTGGNNGTLGNGSAGTEPVWNETSGFDGFGAFEFDGVDDYIEISNNSEISFGLNDSFTISAWIYQKTAGTHPRIIDSKNTSVGGYYAFRSSTNNVFSCVVADALDEGDSYAEGSTVISLNTWYYVSCAWDGSNWKLYVDGQEDTIQYSGTSTGYGYSNSDNVTRIGTRGVGDRGFNGTIDEIVIYDRALSAEQINALYNNRTDLIVSQETALNDTWSIEATPVYLGATGDSVLSNNITVLEGLNITYLLPENATILNYESEIEIGANITTGAEVDTVLLNITSPNSTVYEYALSNSTLTWFNMSYNLSQLGRYNFTIWVNDSSGTNMSQEGYFYSVKVILNSTDLYSVGHSSNGTWENLTANLIGFDGEWNGYVYDWYKNGSLTYSISGNVTDRNTLDNSYTTAGDVWYVNVTPYSGDTYNISNANYITNISTTSITGAPTGIYFNYGGDKMFITGSAERMIIGYDLSDPFNISTATYASNYTNASLFAFSDLTFSKDGTNLYVSTNIDTFYQFELSSTFDLSTATLIQTQTLSESASSRGCAIKNDGTKFYTVNLEGSNDGVYEYNLATAFDLSTAVYSSNFSTSTNANQSASLTFNDDGTRMFVAGYLDSVFTAYDLSTAWDVTSATYNSNYSLSYQPDGIFFATSVAMLYGTDNPANLIHQYEITGVTFGATIQSNNITILPPYIDSVVLNSSLNANYTSENLTANLLNLTPTDSKVVYDWRKDGDSVAVLNMPFEAGSNSTWTKDYSTYSNNVTVNETNYNSAGGYDGNGAYEFDGTNDYINLSNSFTQLDGTEEFSVSAWVKDNDSGAFDTWRGIFARGDTNQRTPWIYGNFSSSGLVFEFETVGGGVSDCLIIAGNITDNAWQLVTATWDGSVCRLYIDGVEVGNDTTVGNTLVTSNGYNYIGTQYNDDKWDGSIDDVLVLRDALSIEEVGLLYNNRTDLIVSSETLSGENWSVMATPIYEHDFGSSVLSNNLTILAPTIESVLLNASEGTNYSDEDLNSYLTNLTPSDVDVSYTWYRNDSVYSGYLVREDMRNSPNGTLVGNATYNASEGYIQLTSDAIGDIGNLYYNMTDTPENWTSEFEFWTGSGTGDAVWFYIYSTSPNMSYEDLSTEGYVIAYDEYNNGGEIQLKYNGTSLTAISQTGFNNSDWHNAKIVKDGLDIEIFLDSVSKINYTDVARNISGDRYLGFGGRTGGATNVHRIRALNVTTNLDKGIISQLISNYTSSGDVWKVRATPYSGHDYGASVLSGEVAIESSLTIENVSLYGYNEVEVAFVNATGYSNNTDSVIVGTNLTINATITNATEIDSVWVKIWEGAIGGVVKFFGWLTDLGDGIWNIVIPTNSSFNESEYNYTLYVNSTAGEEINVSGTFNMSDATIDAVIMNSSSGTNLTSENLRAYAVNVTPSEADGTKVIYDWKVDGQPIAILNMPFDTGASYNNTYVEDFSGQVQGDEDYYWGVLGNGTSGTEPTYNATGGYDSRGAYEFDGSDDLININSAGSLSDIKVTSDFSTSAWVKRASSGSADTIFATWEAGSAYRQYLMWFNSDDRFACDRYDGTVLGPVVNDNDWHFVTCTYDYEGRVMNVYLDGILENSSYIGGQFDLDVPIETAIGTDVNSAYFNGTIDDVVVWNKSLTSGQIWRLYNNESYILSTDETLGGEVWSVSGVPVSGGARGLRVASENLTAIAPSIDAVILNSSSLGNTTGENLTASVVNATPLEVDGARMVYDWRINGSSWASLNLPMDDDGYCGGDICDYSSGAHNATVGAYYNLSEGVSERGAYYFDGSTSYLESYVPDFVPSDGYTVSAWIKRTVDNAGTWERLIAYSDGVGTESCDFHVGISDTGNFTTYFHTGTEWKGVQGGVIGLGEWYYVTATWNGSVLSLYVNGELNVSADYSGFSPKNTENYFNIGRLFEGGSTYYNYTGAIDEVLIWNEALSSEQISAMYNNGTYRTDLVVNGETSVGENWSVMETPVYGRDVGAGVLSDNMTIVVASIWEVVLNSSSGHNLSSDNLTAYAVNVTPADSNVTYDWYKDGSLYSGYLVNENMNNSLLGTLSGDATFVSGQYVQLTAAVGSQIGNLYYNASDIAENWTAEFEFWSGGGNGADVVWFYIYSNSPNMSYPTSTTNGYSIAYDEYNDLINLRYNGTSLQSVADTGLDNSAWRTAKIVKNGSDFEIFLDGVSRINYTDSIVRNISGERYLGFGSYTGTDYNYHRIRNLNVSVGLDKGITSELSSNYTSVGEVWKVSATPWQGSLRGQAVQSNITVSSGLIFEGINVTDEDNISISFVNSTGYVNNTGEIIVGTNATFDVNITNNTEIDSAWIKIWEGAIGGVVKFFGWLSDLGNNIWEVIVPVNSTFNESEYNYTIYVNNTLGEEENISATFNVSGPVVEAVVLNSSLGGNNTAENLTAYPINVTPEDSNITYIWYNNSVNVLNTTGNSTVGNVLLSDNTTAGENWSVVVLPSYGDILGDNISSNNLTIEAVSISSIILNATSSANLSRDNLTAWVEVLPNASSITYMWYNNSVNVLNTTGNSTVGNILLSENTSADENWSVCGIPSYNGTNGSLVCSGNITIRDTLEPIWSTYNTSYGTTNFSAYGNWSNLTDVVLGTQYGLINWSGNVVNAEVANYDSYVKIGEVFVSVNAGSLNETHNVSTVITLYNASCENPVVYYNETFISTNRSDIINSGQVCNATTSPACTAISCTDNTLTFTAPHFSSYASNAYSNLSVWDQNDENGSYANLSLEVNESIIFFGNYTNITGGAITDATCQIWFNDTDNWSSMGFNSTIDSYNYSREFNVSGTYVWNVSCNKTGFGSLNLSDTIFVNDTIAPYLYDFLPYSNSTYNETYNVSDTIEVAVNITDDALVEGVSAYANVTMPNGTVTQVNLNNVSVIVNNVLDKFNGSYVIPNKTGRYNITYMAYDLNGNINSSLTTFFVGQDLVAPMMYDFLPYSNSTYNETYNVSDTIEIAVNVSDNVLVDSVWVNVTLPNGTVEQYDLSNVSVLGNDLNDKYNVSYTVANATGRYNLTFIANDSSGNINSTSTTFFVGEDHLNPEVVVISPAPGTVITAPELVEIAVNVTDYVLVDKVFANVTWPNSTVITLELSNTSDKYNVSFNATADGGYTVVFFANDTSGNLNDSVTTYFGSTVTLQDIVFSNDTVFNYSNTFNESEIVYDETLTYMAANCSSNLENVTSVRFALNNVEDDVTYFNQSYTYNNSARYVVNSSYQIRDSGNWTLYVTCNTENYTTTENKTFEIDWGNLTIDWISPTADTNVSRNAFSTFSANVSCSGGECGAVNVTLDPQPTEEELARGCYAAEKDNCMKCEADCQDSCEGENGTIEDCIECGVGCESDCYEVICPVEDSSDLSNITEINQTESNVIEINNSNSSAIDNSTVDGNATLINSSIVEENVTSGESSNSSAGGVAVPETNETANYTNETLNENLENVTVENMTIEFGILSAYTGGNWTAGEDSFLAIWDQNDVGMPNAVSSTTTVKKINENVTFYADYKLSKNATKISDGTCTILINGSTQNMTYDGSNYYSYTMNMTEAKLYGYTINCTHSSYDNLSVSDYVVIGEVSTSTKGAISTTEGDVPFYTTSENPQNISLRGGDAQTLTWSVNATGQLDKVYDFFIYATGNQISYTNSSHINIEITANDVTAPTFLSVIATPGAVYNGSNVTINANVEDNVQVDSIWGIVTAPSGYNTSFSSVPYTFSNTTETGQYDVTYFANDTYGNEASATQVFDVGENLTATINVSVDVSVDVDAGQNTNFTFKLVHPDNGDVIYEKTSNESFSANVPNVEYNFLIIDAFNGTMNLTLEKVNLSANLNSSLKLDKHSSMSGFLVTYGVSTDYSFNISEVVFSYDGVSYTNEDNLQLWKCSNYNFDARSCTSSNSDVTSSATWNKAGNYFTYDTTTFSGFSIKEYVAPVTETTTTTSGGSGGGCAASLGYHFVSGLGCVKIEENATEVVSEGGVPEQLFDIKMTLEDGAIDKSSDLRAVVTYESFGSVPTPVNLTFEVFDLDGNLLYSQDGYIVVTVEEIRRYEFPDLDLPDGEYEFVFTTLYNVDVFDEFRQKFTVGKRSFFSRITGNVIGFIKEANKVVVGGIGLGVVLLIGLLFLFRIILRHKKKKHAVSKYYNWKKRQRGKLLGKHDVKLKHKRIKSPNNLFLKVKRSLRRAERRLKK